MSVTLAMLLACPLLTLRISGSTGTFPKPLSAEDERKYLELFEAGDMNTRNVLIEHNLRLIAHIIKKYYVNSADSDDLISIGTIGLIKGISTFKPEKGVRLATYAARCVENAILTPMCICKLYKVDIGKTSSHCGFERSETEMM